MPSPESSPLDRLSTPDRIAVEDVLRALLECENRSHQATEAQLSGMSDLDRGGTARALANAVTAGLVREPVEGIWGMSESGREEAVRVMRAHRLTETKLARESGVAPADWHGMAHTSEHRMSIREVNALADRLGNPRFDPHGDPIPTRGGMFPAPQDQPLLDWSEGRIGVIAHVEDEPAELFAQAAAAGVAAGLRFSSVRSGEGMVLAVEGRYVNLARELLPLVRVRPLAADEPLPEAGDQRLSDLPDGATATVVTLLPICVGAERSRLLDLGFVPGSKIERVLNSPLHGPVAYRVRSTLIALRRTQADNVLIRPLANSTERKTA